MTIAEERDTQMIKDRMQYDPKTQTWTVSYPWIKDPIELPDNRTYALSRLISTEKRLSKNPDFARIYKEQIQNMLDRNVARKLTPQELQSYEGPIHYIAHHAVLKPESKSTPCRIVFNSSASFNGHSLNDYHAKGPDVLNDLLGILLRFREYAVAFVGDISKMFHAIRIPPIDQMTHRFLWRNMESHRQPDTYIMTALNMGDKPSTAMAIITLQETANLKESEFPVACDVIRKNSYVDDIADSVPCQNAADNVTKDIESVLHSGGFQIKNWTKNNSPPHAAPTALFVIEESSTKVLGLHWSPSTDQLLFTVRINFSSKVNGKFTSDNLTVTNFKAQFPAILTKRSILSQINGIYDPLGLLSPVTVTAKILMRKVWAYQEKQLDWDDPLPPTLYKEWRDYFLSLLALENISFNRCTKPPNATGQPSLIVFSDGSSVAYGSVAYVRWHCTDGSIKVCLLSSKNRLAPIKTVDVVRLELAGAVTSVRLRLFLIKHMRYQFQKVYHIVDSEIVKAMISKGSYGFNTYAANRVGEIQSSSSPCEWYWLPGRLNISDWITRGKSPHDITSDSEWQMGPSFLQDPVHSWPISQDITSVTLPERVLMVSTPNQDSNETLASRIDISRYSSLTKLLNVTARILNLYKHFKAPKENAPSLALSAKSIQDAQQFWIIDAQNSLRSKETLKKHIKLGIIDNDGILMVTGRLPQSNDISWNNNAFTLLPQNHPLSRLIAIDQHIKGGHRGVSTTISRIRSEYWIIGVRKIVRKLCWLCVPCRIKFQRMESQIMAPLPIERIKPSPPFTHTGIDYFGPFSIRGEVNKRVIGKCYGVLLVCQSSRAVHVDLASDYSTDSFLQLLRRFASIRGWPAKFFSDQGSQLLAASKELIDAIEALDTDRIKEFSIQQGCDWHFSPPDAPWANGATEALVKTVKRNLQSTIGSQVLSFSELQTVMFEVAQITNQRPIGTHPSLPEDRTYLTPNDLLLGRASNSIPQVAVSLTTPLRKRYDFVQLIIENFWRKWSRDVFPNLVIRPKWHVSRRNVMVGDVVMIQDEKAPRGQWRTGIVTKAEPGDDGRVRRVLVAYKNFSANEAVIDYKGTKFTTIERPIHRLIVLVAVDRS